MSILRYLGGVGGSQGNQDEERHELGMGESVMKTKNT